MSENTPHHPPRQTLSSIVRLAVQTLGRSVLGVAALITFPSAIPWMIAVWLTWHTILVIRGWSGWMPLMLCGLVLLVKRVPWPPGLLVLAALFLGVVVLNTGRWWARAKLRRRVARWGAVALWIGWAGMAWQWCAATHGRHPPALDPTRPVVCLGDSLTSMGSDGGYPEELRPLLSIPVINMGQPGITTGDGLRRLPAVLAHNPQVVVLELGGHDFLKQSSSETSGENATYSRADTERNLLAIIEACREIGAEVVLVEIPRGLVTDDYAGLERELARKHGIELLSDTPLRQIVLWSAAAPPGMWFGGPHLSDDGLHPNIHGARLLARRVATRLRRLYGPDISHQIGN